VVTEGLKKKHTPLQVVFLNLCVTMNMCPHELGTKELLYWLSQESYLRNMVSETCHNIKGILYLSSLFLCQMHYRRFEVFTAVTMKNAIFVI
jgi:hypothetical protein